MNISHNDPSVKTRFMLGFIVKVPRFLFLLLAASVLSFLPGCVSAPKSEIGYNDMYEVRSFQVETVTNEIVTTVFILRLSETNTIKETARQINLPNLKPQDDSDYDWDFVYSQGASNGVVDNEKPDGHTQIEFQCVDGTCEVKEQ